MLSFTILERFAAGLPPAVWGPHSLGARLGPFGFLLRGVSTMAARSTRARAKPAPWKTDASADLDRFGTRPRPSKGGSRGRDSDPSDAASDRWETTSTRSFGARTLASARAADFSRGDALDDDERGRVRPASSSTRSARPGRQHGPPDPRARSAPLARRGPRGHGQSPPSAGGRACRERASAARTRSAARPRPRGRRVGRGFTTSPSGEAMVVARTEDLAAARGRRPRARTRAGRARSLGGR